MRSSMMRAASKALTGYSDMHSTLASLASEGMSLMACYHSDFRPPGWQSDAFAANLHLASQGLSPCMEEHASQIAALFESVVGGEDSRGRVSQ